MSSPVPPISAAPVDDHGWRPASAGGGDGFTHPTQTLEFKIERIEPKEGILEVVQIEPSDDACGAPPSPK